MTSDNKRALLAYAIPVDLVVIAAGVAGLLSPDSELLYLPFVVAIAVAAWVSGTEIGLAATGLSVIAMAVCFSDRTDVSALTMVAACGALLCVTLAAGRTIRFRSAGEPGAIPSGTWALQLVSIATLLLVVMVYANVSDLLMRAFSAPSLLQPLLLLLVIAVWRLRVIATPSEVILQPLTILLAAYCFFLFISSIWAGDALASDERFVEALKNLTIFVVAAGLAANWRVLRGALIALTITAALLATLTIGQVISGTHYEFGGLASLKPGNVYGDVSELRASGPLDDPNFYAQLLLLALPLAGFVAWTAPRRAARLFFLMATLLIAAGALLTYSRGAMVALAAAVVVLFFVARIRVIYVVPAALAIIIALSVLPSAVMRRFSTVQALLPGQERVVQDDASIEERKLFLKSAWQMFNDHPLLGVGAGNFNTYYQRYANIVGSSARLYHERGDTAYPHMLYLQIAAETGLLGLALFLAATGMAFRALRRAHRALRRVSPEQALLATALALALVEYLVTALFLHGSYQRDLWLVLAFVAALTRLAARSTSPSFVQRETPA